MTADSLPLWAEPVTWAWICTGALLWFGLVAYNGLEREEHDLLDIVFGFFAGTLVCALIWPFILYAAVCTIRER